MRGKMARLMMAVALCSALSSSFVVAQEEIVSSAAENHDADARPPGISIPDSPGASERLEKAKEKEDRKQWKAAAEFYQEVLEKYSTRVVPVKVDADQGIYQYVGVTEIVQQRLAKWPDDGLAEYRAAYDQTAADLLTAAGKNDVAALAHIFATYSLTESGKSAGMKLLDLHLEAGQFLAAAWTGDRLLQLIPASDPSRSAILFRTALAKYWLGDNAAAKSIFDDLKQKHPNDTGTVAGKDVVLADALAVAMKAPIPSPTTQPNDADNWPGFGGLDGRGGISPSVAKPGAGLNSIPVVPMDYSRIPQAQRSNFQAAEQADIASGQLLEIVPSASDGAIFFQDGRHVYAVTADSGIPLPGWLQTYPAEKGGRFSNDVFGRPRGEQLTVTVTANQVLAVMGQGDSNLGMLGQPVTATDRLVCLDRATGKLTWTRATTEFPDSAATLRTTEFNGTPRVVGDDSVLVIARGGKQNQFEDCYVVCLSLKTGEYKWSTYIGSATHVVAGESSGASNDTSEISIADGRAFVLSNLGTVAAIDVSDGRMLWLTGYPRDAGSTINVNPVFRVGRNFNNAQQANKPWVHNPVMVEGGKVFVLPSDGKALMIYDASTGTEIKRLATSDFDNFDVLLAVRGNWIVATYPNGAVRIASTGRRTTTTTHLRRWCGRPSEEDDPVAGRGFVTADSVYVPSQNRLYQIAFDADGKLRSVYPASGSWASGQGPGNVLVTTKNVIVAGANRVDAYTDLTLIRRQYDAILVAAPKDPEARLKYAEVLFAGAQYSEAIAKMDEAIDLLGGLHAMRTGKDRDLVFLSSLNFCRENLDIAHTGIRKFDRPIFRSSQCRRFRARAAGEISIESGKISGQQTRSAGRSESVPGSFTRRCDALGGTVGKQHRRQ